MAKYSLMKSLGLVTARSTRLIVPGCNLVIKQGWESSTCPYFPNLKPQEKAAVSIELLVEYFRCRDVTVENISHDACPGDIRVIQSGVESLIEVKVATETFRQGVSGFSSSFWFNQIRDDGCHEIILVFATPSHFVIYQFAAESIRRLTSFARGHVGADGLFQVKVVFNSRTCSLEELNTHGRMLDVVSY